MSKIKAFTRPSMPLTPPVFYILLSLSSGYRHGYDIMKQIEKDSLGKVKLGPGTLYGTIKRLLEESLISETKRVRARDQRRRFYEITHKGGKLLQTELQRFEEALVVAHKPRIKPLLKLSI